MIIIADIQDQLGQQVATSIGSHNCTYIRCDVTDENQVKALVESSIQKYGQLDIMFSNAGIISKSDQSILDLDFQQFDRLMAVNLRGMSACVKHAARAMVENKHGVLGLVRLASKQLGMYGIRVNCVSPNGVATPMTCEVHEKSVEEVEEIYEAGRALKGAVLRAEHVADAVLFLASDESELITGHDLAVDGGFQA
ncbi:hypothetical protein Gotri_020405 [Gossypium trilobum]|uniref:Ketoreductase (KR) domain-containing protein n=1 Tax=Gossypium trilobum TaxID=34281 RepID=A0A7J9D998_9ROSI|nr:hypothetical protein [Gossypium trilobum]